MGLDKLNKVLEAELKYLKEKGVLKGEEDVITGIKPGKNGYGPRYTIRGYEDKEFLRMNSNSYLGLSLKKEVIEAEEEAARKYGTGPGAVRFISGTFLPHVELEQKLAQFHGKEAGMIFGSAYSTIMGILPSLIDGKTVVISDELNHNCIINAIRLSRPKDKKIYPHNDMDELESILRLISGSCKRVILVTDGIFSMRGDHAPLGEIAELAEVYGENFEEGIITIIDDSHGVGAFGKTGRGTTEYSGESRIDIIVATLGKALGVNGGYIVSDARVVEYLRERAPFYIYSNPITPAEASASIRALEILDSERGREMLSHLRNMSRRLKEGFTKLGFEVVEGEHPIVPLIIRDTKRTAELVNFLKENMILATGIKYPVVPRGSEEIRFQVSADHTEADIDYVLEVLGKFS